MTVIVNDYVLVRPYSANVVTLGVGQRTDVLVTANGKPTDAIWMRSAMDIYCFPLATQHPALVAVCYPSANQNMRPSTTATPWTSNNCANVSIVAVRHERIQ